MNRATTNGIEAWEDEGGAAALAPKANETTLSGTASQVVWAERIKVQVNADFDRVAASFRAVASKQGDKRADTDAIIAILEEKRTQVMSRQEAGYFIHDWQEITDQVRQMIFHDSRYQAIRDRTLALRL
jgi:hypothetical protein